MSQKGIGRLVSVLLCKESVRGTANTTTGYWVPDMDLAVESKIENVTDEMTYGVIEDSVSQTRVKSLMEGDIKANVRDTHFGLLLKALLGSENSATHAGETIVYDHTFSVSESAQHPSVTIAKVDPLAGVNYTYANGVVHKLEIDYSLKKFVSYSASIKAQAGVVAAGLVPATTSENYFVPQYMTFKVAATTGALAAATAIKLKSAKITIDENIEDQEVLGSVAPADFLNKEFKVEGTLEAIWQGEADFFTAFIANTPQAVLLDLINSDVTIGSTSHPELKITLDQCYFTELTKPYKTKDLVYQTLKFKASYSLTNSSMVKVVLTNLVASAY